MLIVTGGKSNSKFRRAASGARHVPLVDTPHAKALAVQAIVVDNFELAPELASEAAPEAAPDRCCPRNNIGAYMHCGGSEDGVFCNGAVAAAHM